MNRLVILYIVQSEQGIIKAVFCGKAVDFLLINPIFINNTNLKNYVYHLSTIKKKKKKNTWVFKKGSNLAWKNSSFKKKKKKQKKAYSIV